MADGQIKSDAALPCSIQLIGASCNQIGCGRSRSEVGQFRLSFSETFAPSLSLAFSALSHVTK